MKDKRRPSSERVSHLAFRLSPCRVCGAPAHGFHYGVNTCDACKSFFRRSLLRGGEYECFGTGNCTVRPVRRMICSRCRYTKCLNMGMSTNAIKTGRYTFNKRAQDLMEIKMLNRQKTKEQSSDLSSCANSESTNKESMNSNDTFTYSSQSNPSILKGEKETAAVPLQLSSQIERNMQEESQKTERVLAKQLPEKAEKPSMVTVCQNTKVAEQCNPQIEKSALPFECHNTLPTVRPTSKVAGRFNPQMEKPQLPTVCQNREVAKISNPLYPSELSSELLDDSVSSSVSDGVDQIASPYKEQNSDQLKPTKFFNSPFSPASDSPHSTTSTSAENELENIISTLVAAHKAYVFDCNGFSEEYFAKESKNCAERCKLKQGIFGPMGPIESEEHLNIYRDTGLDVDGRIDKMRYTVQWMSEDIRSLTKFSKAIPGFNTLPQDDQINLVKYNLPEYFLLSYYRGANWNEMTVVEQTRSFCLHELMQFLDKDVIYNIFESSWKMQKLNLTYEIVVILKAFCIFSTVEVELKQPAEVEKIQLKLLECLLLELRRTFRDKHGLMLARIISLLAHQRTSPMRKTDSLQKLRLQCSALPNHPMLTKFCEMDWVKY